MPIESGVPGCLRSLAASGVAVIAVLGGQTAIAPIAFADTSATVEAQTQRMSDATLTSRQDGSYSAGDQLTLVCATHGQDVVGYSSSTAAGRDNDLWYQTSDGHYVSDVDIATNSLSAAAPDCGTAPTASPQSAPAQSAQAAQSALGPQSALAPQSVMPQGTVPQTALGSQSATAQTALGSQSATPQTALAAQTAAPQSAAPQAVAPQTVVPQTATSQTVLATQNAAASATDPVRTAGRTSTMNPGTPGQCTWGAAQKWFEITGSYPGVTGDAWTWRDSAAAAGYTVVDGAQERSVVVFQPGVAGAGGYGHVAFVDSVTLRPDGKWIHVTEMNNPFLGGVGIFNDRDIKDVPGMSYILMP